MADPLRVASLLPSATEMVCAVGARDRLVGVSHECDHPVGVETLPALTRVRRELPRASGAIDRTVREILTDALAVYEVDVERMRETKPDVVVTQELCDVCAVSLDDVRQALQELVRTDVTVVSLKPTRLADVWDDVRKVGQALGESERGESAAQALEDRCGAIGSRSATLSERPSVLTIEWLDPIMIGGTWMPELVALAGGRALVTEAGQHAPTLEFDALSELDPDVVVVKPCGFELARTATELDLLPKMLPLERWSAARNDRVYVADGNAFFNRPGPRLVESLEIMAACVHPTEFADFRAAHVGNYRRLTKDLELVDA